MNAGEFPEKIRAFVAIFPSETIVARLKAVQTQLENVLRSKEIRWTEPEQIHLTLQFLGTIEQKQLAEFPAAMELAVQKHRAFQLNAGKVGCFPNLRRPRIIWAGLNGELNRLNLLKEDLDRTFSNFGYVPEKRVFLPHLTMGRVAESKAKDVARLAKEISEMDAEVFGEWNVQKVHLMQSVLSPKGAVYRVLKSVSLENN